MAVIPWSVVTTAVDGPGLRLIRWSGLAGADSGQPFVVGQYTDKSVQFISMDGNGVTIQGSLDNAASPTWATLNDPQGNALSAVTSDKLENILEHCYQLRPLAGASLTSGTILLLLGSSK